MSFPIRYLIRYPIQLAVYRGGSKSKRWCRKKSAVSDACESARARAVALDRGTLYCTACLKRMPISLPEVVIGRGVSGLSPLARVASRSRAMIIAALQEIYDANPNIVTTLCTLVALCLATGLLQPAEKPAASAKAAAVPAAFTGFQRNYLLTYGVIQLADWLQGTHFHSLYAEHGLTDSQTSSLFLTGFLSSALFGTYIGVLVDSIGRKRGCIIYCVLEVVINTLEHSPSYEVLWVGRILGGISTSLLGCSFESWMVTRHKAEGFTDALLEQTFSKMSFLNGA